MNDKLRKKLPGAAERVVRKAMRSGAVDRGEFTMSEARRLVTIDLGLEEGALDAKDAKQLTREVIQEAIVSTLDDRSTSLCTGCLR